MTNNIPRFAVMVILGLALAGGVFIPKGANIVPTNTERDIYFCGTAVCSENSPGAVPSGWIGEHN